MNSIDLLLPKNGRPLFAGKILLERISFNQRYNESSESDAISKEELLANKIALKAFSNALIEFDSCGIQRSEDDYKLLINFPLFLEESFVKEWEVDKIWKKFNVEDYILNTYEEKISGKTPSIAYTPSKCGYANEIWKTYFLNAPLAELVSLIETSISYLDNYIENREHTRNSTIEINIKDIAQYFQLGPEDVYTLYWSTVLFDSKLNHVNKLWERLLTINSFNAIKFFGFIETALGCPNETMLNRLTADKPLVNYLLFQEVSNKNVTNDMIKKNSGKDWFSIWNSIITPLNKETLKVNYRADNETIISKFLKIPEKTDLDLKNWDYLNGIISIWKTQLITSPTKILFYGAKGCGKTSLSLSLLDSIGLNVFSPVEEDLDSYLIAVRIIKNINNSALLVNESKELFKNPKILKNIDYNLIWNVENLEDIPENYLKQFDYIYNLSEIPFENRLEFSKSKFIDQNLAIKIAQQLKTFGSIEKAATLVTNEADWKTVYPHVNIEKRNVGKNFQVIDYSTFKDIPNLAGYKDLYKSFDTILDLFNNPYKYQRLNAKTPKGFLIEGAPGTGKTLFVKQIAKKSQLPLIVANSSQLAENLEELKDVFDYARLISPCILFFDEIDTLLTNPITPFSIDSKKQQILNAMLSEIDGVKSLAGVIVLGTTNHLRNISPIALRSGRISEIISVGIPSTSDRIEIWESYLSTKPTETVDYAKLSKISNGFSGADIAEASNQSALIAAYDNSEIITAKHIDRACENVLFGRADGQLIVTHESRWKTAVHEVGHALMALKFNREVGRVTVVPRQGALGITHMLKEEGFHSFTKTQLKEFVAIFLGGIVAEKVIFKEYESGGSSDLDMISKKVYSAYMTLGFSDSIGPIATKSFDSLSEKRKIILEDESSALVKEIFKETEDFLMSSKALLNECAEELLKERSVSIETTSQWKIKLVSLIREMEEKNKSS